MESFGFNQELKGQTKGQAFPQSVFDHWDTMPGCKLPVSQPHNRVLNLSLTIAALEPGSRLGDLVKKLRVRKGLRPEVPPLEHFNDRYEKPYSLYASSIH
jgi:elongation factor 2